MSLFNLLHRQYLLKMRPLFQYLIFDFLIYLLDFYLELCIILFFCIIHIISQDKLMQSKNQNSSKIYPTVYKIGENKPNYGQPSTTFSYQSSIKNQYPIQTTFQPQNQSVKPQTQPQRTSRVSVRSQSSQRYNYITFDNPSGNTNLIQSQQYYPTQFESNIPQTNPIKLINSGSACRYNIGTSRPNYMPSINFGGHNSVSSSFTANNQNQLIPSQVNLASNSNLQNKPVINYQNTFKALQTNNSSVNGPINSRLTQSYEYNNANQTSILTKNKPTITTSNISPHLNQSLQSIQQISTLKNRINGLQQQNKKQKELRIRLQQKLAQIQKQKSVSSQKFSQQSQLIEKLQVKIQTLQAHQQQLTIQNRKYSIKPSIEAITNLENKIVDLQNSYNIYQLVIQKQKSLITILDNEKMRNKKNSMSKTNKNSSTNTHMNDEENILRNQIKLLYKDIQGDQNGKYE